MGMAERARESSRAHDHFLSCSPPLRCHLSKMCRHNATHLYGVFVTTSSLAFVADADEQTRGPFPRGRSHLPPKAHRRSQVQRQASLTVGPLSKLRSRSKGR
jgi:hypothetical protein